MIRSNYRVKRDAGSDVGNNVDFIQSVRIKIRWKTIITYYVNNQHIKSIDFYLDFRKYSPPNVLKNVHAQMMDLPPVGRMVDLPLRQAGMLYISFRICHLRMTYSVYAIKSISKKYIYVWLTDNIERRLYQHNTWKSRTTKPYAPFILIYKEELETRPEARIREKYFKSWQWKDFLKAL